MALYSIIGISKLFENDMEEDHEMSRHEEELGVNQEDEHLLSKNEDDISVDMNVHQLESDEMGLNEVTTDHKIEAKVENKKKRKNSKKSKSTASFKKSISEYSNPRIYEKRLVQKLEEWTGGEGNAKEAINWLVTRTKWGENCGPSKKEQDFAIVGKRIVETIQKLPLKSPLRKYMIHIVSEGSQNTQMAHILGISEASIRRSHLASHDLILNMKPIIKQHHHQQQQQQQQPNQLPHPQFQQPNK